LDILDLVRLENPSRHAFGTPSCYGHTMSEPTNWFTGAPPGDYHSCLVRIWRPGPQSEWRILAAVVATGEQRTFASLEELCSFLQTELGPAATPPDGAARQTPHD
jgi:hypothetical protein